MIANTNAPGLNALWSRLMIEELVRNRCTQFVLSPGSRSTPLTDAVATHDLADSVIHIDERGAAFFALGWARATGRPAVLVCTSGTAAANYYPAVVEAAMDRVPMIVLTADRPPELLNCGANQAIDQAALFGKYVRFHSVLPCPDASVAPEVLLTTVDQAVYLSGRAPKGPVHLNCMFREPLAPLGPQKEFRDYLRKVRGWMGGTQPYTTCDGPALQPEDDRVEAVAATIAQSRAGLLTVGGLDSSEDTAAAARLSRKLNWPTVADIRSGLRTGGRGERMVTYFDQMLLSEAFASWTPSTVLHLGGVFTAKRSQIFLERCRPGAYIHVAPHPFRQDPGHRVTHRVESDIRRFCEMLIPRLKRGGGEPAFWERLRQADSRVGRIVEDFLFRRPELTEPGIARMVSRHIAPGGCLFLGNSMPVRDMDMYGDPDGGSIRVGANRGASGIDGTVASAAGFAHGARTAGTVLMGDLAFLHDLNSLALIGKITPPLVVIVVNNHGGGIFSFLPVARCTEIFEPYFGTPHALTFEKAADMFGLGHCRPESNAAFVEAYQQAQNSGTSTVIEVTTDRRENARYHLVLQEKIKSILDAL